MKTRPALLHGIALTLLSLAAATNSIHAATITVTNTADSGPGSLRQAIVEATAGDTITFSLPANSAITLTSGELLINKNLTIAGPGANLLTVRRDYNAPNFRIFDIGGNGQVAISGLTISGGKFVGGVGGGIFNQSGTLLLNGVAISGNSSDQGGGGLANNGVVTIRRSTISGNSASAGGGITGLGTFTIWDSTISGNTALTGIALGGGIRVGGSVDLINSTVAGNAAGDGGGIFNNGFISGTVSARNTIIALNTASNGPNVNGALTSKNFNLIGNSAGANITPPSSPSYDQTDVSAAELNLGPLQDNGGPTRTHALLSGSTAIDRGDFEGERYDQRGPDFPRPVDSPTLAGNGDGSDIGAYEVQADSLAGCITLVENNNDSGPGSLRDAIEDACAGSTISFAANVRGAITLTSYLSIQKRLTINGPGANRLTVQRSTASGTPAFPIFAMSREHVTISGLAIANGSYAQGGGISTFSNLTINDCTILDNTANEGGGIYSYGGRLTINNSTISGNSAVGAGDGGGIYIDSSIVSESVTINNSTISGNSADGRGGGIYNLSELTINNSTISGNSAVAEAGGIANGNLVVIASSTITGNSGASGGGISALGGGNLGVRNSIIALNIERDPFSDFPDIDHRGGQGGSGGHNLIGELGEFEYEFERSTSDQIGTPASPIDPKLGPLQNNGGPTQTHALLSTSPAVDKGRSSGSLTDQRGLSRPIDDPGITNATGGDAADIGAFEMSPGVIAFNNATYQINEGVGTIIFNLVRSGGRDGAVSAICTTSNGTAQAGSDYVAKSAMVSFGYGETAKTFTVAITDDAFDEANETFTVTLSNPASGATLGAPLTRTATILDNDPLPVIAINNVTVPEGNTGTVNASFAVTLNNASLKTVTVNYATANGTAAAGSDYTAATGTLTFTPGQTSRSISVPIKGDTLDEANETFNVNLSSAVNGGIGDNLGIGTITDNDATPTPTPTPGLVGNVSTRLPVGTGDNALFGGFIVVGPNGSTKKIMVRALGPFLSQFGVTDALANPTLEIRDGSNTVVARNNNWKSTQLGGVIPTSQVAEIQGSGLAPSNDLESAIVANLAPGSYTAVVRGVNDAVGTGIVDAYDMSPASPARLANVATRGLIQPGDKLMIAGFIIQNGSVRAAIRAIGPSLTQFGITNALPDTTLEVRNQNGTFVRMNDDWQDDPAQKQELENSGLQPGNALEAAIVTTLPPGQYSALVRGKPESTGTGVVEVYFLQ